MQTADCRMGAKYQLIDPVKSLLAGKISAFGYTINTDWSLFLENFMLFGFTTDLAYDVSRL